MNNLPVVRSPWRIVILLLGFTFLYAPMLMLVIYSFNSSKLVTVWAAGQRAGMVSYCAMTR
ncbi:hypothetical protein ECZU01_49020 [Escherichia coli]|nr:hypothetical protein ECZU01_49020 [Escherichia coli]